jgi:hypothetical protein
MYKMMEMLIWSPFLTKSDRKKIVEDFLDKFYGKLEIPLDEINLSKIQASNGGLLEKPT